MVRPTCASCKHQRRRCEAHCPLTPYLPPDRHVQFLNVNKLFRIRNVVKIINDLEPEQRHDAMRTIIFQAEMKARDPVRGCLGVIEVLQRQINWTRAELEVILAHLHAVKQLQINHGAPVGAHHGGLSVRSFTANEPYGVPLILLHMDGGAAGDRNMVGMETGFDQNRQMGLTGGSAPQPPSLAAGVKTEVMTSGYSSTY